MKLKCLVLMFLLSVSQGKHSTLRSKISRSRNQNYVQNGESHPKTEKQNSIMHSKEYQELSMIKWNSLGELESIGHLSFVDLAEIPSAAMLHMEKLYEMEDRIAKDKDVKIKEQTPASAHLKFSEVSEKARHLALKALEISETTKVLKSRLGIKDIDVNIFRMVNITDLKRSGSGCPVKPVCPKRTSKYRTFDGSCNNIARPWIGLAMSPFQRLLPANYHDGVDKPRCAMDDNPLPEPRMISLTLSAAKDDDLEDTEDVAEAIGEIKPVAGLMTVEMKPVNDVVNEETIHDDSITNHGNIHGEIVPNKEMKPATDINEEIIHDDSITNEGNIHGEILPNEELKPETDINEETTPEDAVIIVETEASENGVTHEDTISATNVLSEDIQPGYSIPDKPEVNEKPEETDSDTNGELVLEDSVVNNETDNVESVVTGETNYTYGETLPADSATNELKPKESVVNAQVHPVHIVINEVEKTGDSNTYGEASQGNNVSTGGTETGDSFIGNGVANLEDAVKNKDNELPSNKKMVQKRHTAGESETPEDDSITAFLADFAQFIDHDMTLSPVFTLAKGIGIQCCLFDGSSPQPARKLHPECLPISLPKDDPEFAEFDQRCMNFVRTMPALPYDCAMGPRQQMNAVTHYIDGSMIYGNSEKEVRSLRGRYGRLRTGRTSSLLPPQWPSKCMKRTMRDDPELCFLAGDPRVIEQPLQTSLQTLFMREHNRIADLLYEMHPSWRSRYIFEETRRIVIAELQHITYNELLPALLGPTSMNYFKLNTFVSGYSNLYNKDVDGSILNEFATAAFRLHTLTLGTLRFTKESGFSEQKLLRFFFDSPQILDWPNAGDDLIRGQCSRPSGAFDPHIAEDLTDYMFQMNDAKGGDTFGLDIFSLNVNRGRDHGLRGYNDYREMCGLTRAKTFDDLADALLPDALESIKDLYGHVDDIDLFVGGISEIKSFGSVLGPTFICIIGDQFARTRQGDSYFYDMGNQPSSFTKDQLDEIRKTSMARIICDNSMTIKKIQPQVFFKNNILRNPIVWCDSPLIPSVNLRAWIDEQPETEGRE